MISATKYFFVVINLLHLVIGALMIGFGLWLQYGSPLKEVLVSDNAALSVIQFVIATGAFLICLGLVGMAGNVDGNKPLLGIYLGISIFLVILEVSVLAYGYTQKDSLKATAQVTWITLTDDVKFLVQQRFNCCGYIDATEWNNTFDASCLTTESNSSVIIPWPVGCFSSINTWLDDNGLLLAALAGGVMIVSLCQAILSGKLLWNEVKKKSNVEDSSKLVSKQDDDGDENDDDGPKEPL